MKKHVICAALAAMSMVSLAKAANVGTDNANAYGSWTDGSNAAVTGNAFGAWGLSTYTNDGGSAGFFLGSSTDLGGTGIDSNGKAFGMYGNGGPAYANAQRSFSSALDNGQVFSIDIAVNYRNGNKGLNLLDGSGNNLFNFNIAGDNYVVNDAVTGNGSIGDAYSNNTNFSLSFQQTSAAGGTWTITRSGGVNDVDSGTYGGLASGFKLYEGATDQGQQNNFYANNLSIASTPEPASLALLGLGSLVALRRRSRK